MALSRKDRIDTWLRSQGLPYLVPRDRRAADLLQRAAPLTVLLGGGVILTLLLGPLVTAAFTEFGEALGAGSLLLVVVTLILAIVVPIAAAWWLRRAMIRWGDTRGQVVAVGLGLVYVAAALIIAAIAKESMALALAEALGSLALTHAFVWSGLGSVLGWAGRWAWRSLGAVQNLASRALPLILILVVFAFFSTEPWQIADAMGWRRKLALTAVIVIIAVLAMLPVARAELSSASDELTDEQIRTLLAGTPLAEVPAADVAPRPLSRSGRVNVLAVLVFAHLIQAVMFTLVITALLVTIGRIAITDAVVKAWLTHERKPYTVLGETLPLDRQTLSAAFLLGLIGALSFILSSLSDPNYRNLFFDPLLERVRVAVAAHRALGESTNDNRPTAEPPTASGEAAPGR